jgi:hypothetical protein
MNDTIIFGKRDRHSNELSRIARNDEKTRNLKSIIEKKSKTLYLITANAVPNNNLRVPISPTNSSRSSSAESAKANNEQDDDISITVQINDSPSRHARVNLNLKDKLSKIREILETSEVEMNYTFSFAYKVNTES